MTKSNKGNNRIAFLYTSDTHGTGKSPASRKDSFLDTLKAKFDEIVSLGYKYEVDAFLHGGDFWEGPSPSLNIAADIINHWSRVDIREELEKALHGYRREAAIYTQLKSLLESGRDAASIHTKLQEIVESEKTYRENIKNKLKGYIPTYGIGGNHDFFHKSAKTLPRTMLGFMESLGIIKFVSKENPLIIEKNGTKVAVTGCHYHIDIDTDRKEDYVIEEKMGDIHIHLTHGMLSDTYLGKMFAHTVVDEIAHTKADLTLCGHDHIGFDMVERNGKYFCNPGSPVRMKADKREIKRKPKVLLIEIIDGELKVTPIYLKTARPGEEVLDRQKIEEQKDKELQLAEIVSYIEEAGSYSGSTAFEIIEEVANKDKISKKIRDKVIERVSKYVEVLG